MKPILRNILAIIAGWLVGSAVNLGLINIGHNVYPIEGINPSDFEALAEVMPTLDAEYFIFPFLAHALGTFVGAVVAALIAVNNKMKFALGVGVIFLIGGIAASLMIPAPTWFVLSDLVLAYLPMAWIGGKLVTSRPAPI